MLLVLCSLLPKHVFASCNISSLVNGTISNAICSIDSNTIEGIDVATTEESTTNIAALNVINSSITINTNAGLIVGSVILSGGSTISTLTTNSFIKTGPAWVNDYDSDGYAGSFTQLYTATASGRRRLGRMQSTTAIDCYDLNANAKPNSTYCSNVNRGDGSFDYDCTGVQLSCGTQYYTAYSAAYMVKNKYMNCTGNYGYLTLTGGNASCGTTGYLMGGYQCLGNAECVRACGYNLGASGVQACH